MPKYVLLGEVFPPGEFAPLDYLVVLGIVEGNPGAVSEYLNETYFRNPQEVDQDYPVVKIENDDILFQENESIPGKGETSKYDFFDHQAFNIGEGFGVPVDSKIASITIVRFPNNELAAVHHPQGPLGGGRRHRRHRRATRRRLHKKRGTRRHR